MDNGYGMCSVSVCALRQDPNHRSEQITQLLFGERVTVLQDYGKGLWTKVRCQHDGYEGWCMAGQISPISLKQYEKPAKNLSATDKGYLQIGQQRIWIPVGSVVPHGNMMPDDTSYGGKKAAISGVEFTVEGLTEVALRFEGVPYQWGGRTSAGIDCSGLTQICFRLCGLSLPRDAWQQATVGSEIGFFPEAKRGDLAFFSPPDSRINHVGILLGEDFIIHATDIAGRVVVDKIDSGGIVSQRFRKRTHFLRLIRRYVVE
jgi:cell wall-associated NlpC family hydrolase